MGKYSILVTCFKRRSDRLNTFICNDAIVYSKIGLTIRDFSSDDYIHTEQIWQISLGKIAV